MRTALIGTFRVRRREYSAIGVNAVLLVLAVEVVWGRFGPYSVRSFRIRPRPAHASRLYAR
ncbi:hypothetical protein DKT74_22570 [Streptomyces sp. ZEA17I]|uniref:hypothetical protein n=1 Tax=Streptomyces sp. ZEA17I TaxID=2202516 RepID=UPI000D6FCD8D|nr:hypothetical protein [Streptomyces sp. ZEA17I]PWS42351.1 hypothetical protein DKT74_22570 [Streptomyces sp. ZEA17I]